MITNDYNDYIYANTINIQRELNNTRIHSTPSDMQNKVIEFLLRNIRRYKTIYFSGLDQP